MIMLASDLDRTLIYSRRMLDESGENPGDIRVAETKNGEVITYVTERTLRLLGELSRRGLFVPVTTRTTEQYFRISAIADDIRPRYAITSNGGNIFKNGDPDREWHEQVKSRIADECLPLEDAFRKFESIRSDKWVKFSRIADELFFYCVLRMEHAPFEEIDRYAEFLERNNWHTTLHGRKLYFIPNSLSKAGAVAHVAEQEEVSQIITAGDSLLDLDMAEVSDSFISPRHGEVYQLHRDGVADQDMQYTDNYGITASDEILENAIRILDQAESRSANSSEL
ncbi:MAG: hypothetical protein B6245_02115 [Desulfobacteraceae bacterium 4572_88]|nr:MAG: hypothetical protein B6245_02115 [Desulfobacteraceae bacterium 4572_88]